MPPVPKKKMTKSRSARRTVAQKLSMGALSKCPKCGSLRQSHKACPSCGFYK